MSKRQPRGVKPAEPPSPPAKKREPTPQEQRGIDKAFAYCRSRTPPLAFDIKKAEGSDITVGIPHNNAGGFIAQQRATFGTVSQDFADRAGGEVGNALRDRGQALPSPKALNAGVAAVAGIEPKNEHEAMLAVQMVGTHAMAMEMMNLAKQTESIDRMERYGNLATKFLRTYTTQMETLAKLRRGGEQTVRVEHVHVYQGGQAIVGQVTQVGGAAAGDHRKWKPSPCTYRTASPRNCVFRRGAVPGHGRGWNAGRQRWAGRGGAGCTAEPPEAERRGVSRTGPTGTG